MKLKICGGSRNIQHLKKPSICTCEENHSVLLKLRKQAGYSSKESVHKEESQLHV